MMKHFSNLRSKISSPSTITTRAQQVGGLSLAALLIGGSILILFSVNIVTSKEIYHSNAGENVNGATMVVFRYGSQLGVQAWLAVLGVAFGLLSFGMNQSFTHLFDCWCSSRANQSPGLNYARYLNTQPQSPILIGVRGFPAAIVIRNIIVALGILVSAGYSFVVVDVAVDIYQHLDQSLVHLRIPPSDALLVGGITSPWLGDSPLSGFNRAFTHQEESGSPAMPNPSLVPKTIVMVGWADCGASFSGLDDGILYTREVVLLARKTQDTFNPDVFMTENLAGWVRVENVSSKWLRTNSSSLEQSVVDYTIPGPGRIEIQWARAGNWLRNATERQPVLQKVAFEIELAVAIVRRFVTGPDCSILSDQDGASLSAEIVTNSKDPVVITDYQDALWHNQNWIGSILLNDTAGPAEGVSALIRSVMSYWSSRRFLTVERSLGSYLGHAPLTMPTQPPSANTSNSPTVPGSNWINETEYNKSATNFVNSSLFDFPALLDNDATRAARSQNLSAAYPVYAGRRTTGQTGSYHSVIYLFIALGLFSYLLVAFRMYLGPAELTSWVGQHVYLAGLGAKVPKEATDHLADGHQAASESRLGRLRIKANEPIHRPYYRYPNLAADYELYQGRWVNDGI